MILRKFYTFCVYSVDIILRAEIVETVQGGDQYLFTGTLIAVPDVGVLQFPGAKAELKARKDRSIDAVNDGIRGLKALGARNLNYRLAFLASSATLANTRVSNVHYIFFSHFCHTFSDGKSFERIIWLSAGRN